MLERATGQSPKGLRKLRILAGKRLYDVRRVTGMSESTISRIERGERAPRPEELAALAEALNVSEAELAKSIAS